MNKSPLIPIEQELRKLDMTEKEIRVYLASLELKRASAQNIAKLAGLSRPTAYRAIENLAKKGLLSKIKQNGAGLVMAQSPNEILGLVRAQKRRFEEQEREFLRVISLLKNKYYFHERNEIKFFSGREGMDLLLDDLSLTQAKNIAVTFLGSNKAEIARLENIYKKLRRRLGKITVRELYSRKISPAKLEFITRKNIPSPVKMNGTIILADKALYLEKDRGLLIENEETVAILKTFFDIIWQIAT